MILARFDITSRGIDERHRTHTSIRARQEILPGSTCEIHRMKTSIRWLSTARHKTEDHGHAKLHRVVLWFASTIMAGVLPHEGMLPVGLLSFRLLLFLFNGRRLWACCRRLRRGGNAAAQRRVVHGRSRCVKGIAPCQTLWSWKGRKARSTNPCAWLRAVRAVTVWRPQRAPTAWLISPAWKQRYYRPSFMRCPTSPG